MPVSRAKTVIPVPMLTRVYNTLNQALESAHDPKKDSLRIEYES